MPRSRFELVMGSNDTPELTKTCTKCGEEKTAGEFGKDSTKPDGLRSWCKKCRSMRNKDSLIKEALENAAYRLLKERGF